jgi:hypothetical protein
MDQTEKKTRAFLLYGEEVEVVERITSGVVVHHVYVDFSGEEFVDDKNFIVDKVFDTPPRNKLDETIQELQKKIESLRKKQIELQSSIKIIEDENAKRLEKLKKYKGLENLENFIDGKITHYAVLNSYPEIITFPSKNNERRLLTLFGNSNGDLNWKLNRYNDGSGSDTIVVPCLSYEQAVDEIRNYIMSNLDYHWFNSRFIELASELEFALPEEYITAYNNSRIKSINAQILEHNRCINTLAKELKEIQEGGIYGPKLATGNSKKV